MSEPCTQGHPCVWMRDAGTSYKCTLPRCVVSVTDIGAVNIIEDEITGMSTWAEKFSREREGSNKDQ
jgi:hypothetical protein